MQDSTETIKEEVKARPVPEQFLKCDPKQASACHTKEIPLWLVLLDNVPTLALFILGAFIIAEISLTGALAFFAYALGSVVWFWAKICPYCHQYDSRACPCGYGTISAKLFKKQDEKQFKKIFSRNLPVVFPNWFVPFFVALYLLYSQYNQPLLYMTIGFSLIGFVIIPMISKFVGCKSCEIKDDCPWMRHKVQNIQAEG